MQTIALDNLPLIKEGDSIPDLILGALAEKKLRLEDDDIVVVGEKIVAKAEGCVVSLQKIRPSKKAVRIAKKLEKDPRLVELIIRESKEIIVVEKKFIITETKHGFVCANAGIDQSNIEEGGAKLLPKNPDGTAKVIRMHLEKKTGKRLGVIIIDSFGRPFRYGSVGVAIGVSGIRALWDRRGEEDIYGKKLLVTRVAVADCIASAASIIMGEANERIPAVIVRGLKFHDNGKGSDLIRDRELDVFR